MFDCEDDVELVDECSSILISFLFGDISMLRWISNEIDEIFNENFILDFIQDG